MARVCQVTGKKPMAGNNVSHANNKTKRRFLPNLQYCKFWVESERRWVRLRVSTAAARTNTKNGIEAVHADRRARGEACYPLLRADKKHGKVRSRKNQTRVFCRYVALLHHYEEQENNARKNRDQKTDPRARKHVMYKEAKIKQV